MRVLTFGHGTAGAPEMLRLLRDAGVRRLVDVRIAPGSRRNPEANRDAMSQWLNEAGIEYTWEKRLGGFRSAGSDSPDTALRNRSFAGYAEHMRSPQFRDAIDDLLRLASGALTAVMCAETVWWRCHRKMIADYLVLVRHVDVDHLMHDGSLHRHRPSPEASVVPGAEGDAGELVYDRGQSSLPASATD